MGEVVLAAAVRTAIGRIGGALKGVAPEDLAAFVMQAAIERAGVGREALDEVILGQAKQSSDQPNIARLAALLCDIPETVPAYTVHRQCGSGMQAVHSAVQAVVAGDARVVLAGGVESMSTAPYYLRAARFGYSAGNGEVVDPNTESQPRSQPIARYGYLTMGMTAENLAVKYGITRHRQDEFALESQEKAAAAIAGGAFDDEIVPVVLPGKKEAKVFSVDEHPRATSLEELGKLRPAFKENGTVTAGNSSGRNDGAAALLVASGESARALGIRPMARVVAQAAVGVAPDYMGIGPAPAIRLALKRAGLGLKDIGLFEINEAFAAQTLAVVDELGLDTANLNVNGGAIALGHPIGCSGARILVTLLHEMAKRRSRYGCAALCIAGGMGIATIVELL